MLGFNERVGSPLVKTDFTLRVLTDLVRQNGYQQISIPIIEKASSFSEEVVGESPWPGFKEEGCFFFEMHDYGNDYDDKVATHKVLLVPEGTTSITRWLGESLDKNEVQLPIRVFYDMKCFRNELISSLTAVKGREFTQFGTEVMGTDSIMAEVETIWVIVKSLESFGVARDAIHVRFNDITIFNMLIEESELQDQRVFIKEQLDSLAGVKVGKRPERRDGIIQNLDRVLSRLPPSLRAKWDAVVYQDDYSVVNASKVFGDAYGSKFQMLTDIQEAFSRCGVLIDLDLCVIRSHEYYTSMSFEVDVVGRHVRHPEVAGGGRYDRLVGSFVQDPEASKIIPCVGFAFGMERFIEMLESEGAFDKTTVVSSVFSFTDDTSLPDDDIITTVRDALSPSSMV